MNKKEPVEIHDIADVDNDLAVLAERIKIERICVRVVKNEVAQSREIRMYAYGECLLPDKKQQKYKRKGMGDILHMGSYTYLEIEEARLSDEIAKKLLYDMAENLCDFIKEGHPYLPVDFDITC